MMITRATLLLFLAGLGLIGLMDRDGRIARGDLMARTFGYVLRIELTVQRPGRLSPATPLGWNPDRCVMPDSVTRVAVWR
jgi:hypothetical protein